MSLMVHPFRLSLVCFLLAVSLCKSTSLRAQNFVVFDNIEALQARIARAGDTTILINFWATWCSSCVEELPCFDEIRDYYGPKDLQVVLVSLDFNSKLENKFIPFLERQKIKAEVGLMADQDLDGWIPQIYNAWDGALPATLLIKGEKQRFKLGKFEDIEDLEFFVRPFVTNSAATFNDHPYDTENLNGGKK